MSSPERYREALDGIEKLVANMRQQLRTLDELRECLEVLLEAGCKVGDIAGMSCDEADLHKARKAERRKPKAERAAWFQLYPTDRGDNYRTPQVITRVRLKDGNTVVLSQPVLRKGYGPYALGAK